MYPQGESGPAGCTRRRAKAAAIRRANIQLLAVGPSRDGRASRCSNDFKRLNRSSICQRIRYNPRMPIVGICLLGKVVSTQVTSPVRVRAATARAGNQAIALAEFQVLWLRVGSGGIGIVILNSTAPTLGTSASFSAK